VSVSVVVAVLGVVAEAELKGAVVGYLLLLLHLPGDPGGYLKDWQ